MCSIASQAGILLQPCVPGLAGRLLDRLAVQDRQWGAAALSGAGVTAVSLAGPTKQVLFTKVR